MNEDQYKLWVHIEFLKQCLREKWGYGTGIELHGWNRQEEYNHLHRSMKKLAKKIVSLDERIYT